MSIQVHAAPPVTVIKRLSRDGLMPKSCEICGADIEHGVRIMIEGTELEVCPKCAELGVRVADAPKKASVYEYQDRRILVSTHRRRGLPEFVDEIIEDYASVIRKARESRGLTQEKLADLVNEKLSLIRKIERGDIVPDDKVRKKLEHNLDVKLTTKVTPSEYERHSGPKELTLGDIVNIKRK